MSAKYLSILFYGEIMLVSYIFFIVLYRHIHYRDAVLVMDPRQEYWRVSFEILDDSLTLVFLQIFCLIILEETIVAIKKINDVLPISLDNN